MAPKEKEQDPLGLLTDSKPKAKAKAKPAAKKKSGPRDPSELRQKATPVKGTRLEESRKALKEPLGPGQKYFESPEGFVMIGEDDKNHIWCRDAADGKGAWINPRR